MAIGGVAMEATILSSGPAATAIASALVKCALGFLAYREPVTATKIAGVGACLIGLWLINR